MDWYYGCGTDDFIVPNDQDSLDRLPSPQSWSKWGISAPEDLYSPQKFFVTDKNSTEAEFNFNNEVEFEPSQYDIDQSCDQLQELSSFEPMEDIYLYKRILNLKIFHLLKTCKIPITSILKTNAAIHLVDHRQIFQFQILFRAT